MEKTADPRMISYEEKREGKTGEFMDKISRAPRSYESRGLVPVGHLNTDPGRPAYDPVFHLFGIESTIYIRDRPLLETFEISIFSGDPTRAKSEFLKIVNDKTSAGVRQ